MDNNCVTILSEVISVKVFIGGSKTVKKLDKKAISILNEICDKNYEILIGDCFGADRLIQNYLHQNHYHKVTVYASGNVVRNNTGNFNTKLIPVNSEISGFEFYRQKDIDMAKDSDFGFMIWDGKSRGTMSNIIDLINSGKNVIVISSNPR